MQDSQDIYKYPQGFTSSKIHDFLQAPSYPIAYAMISAQYFLNFQIRKGYLVYVRPL